MEERKQFKKYDLYNMLREVSMNLRKPVSAVLIGGMAMMYHGAKQSTKDIDLVFQRKDDITHFIETIKKMGFRRKEELSEDYLDLKAHGIYFSEEGHMLDLFCVFVLDGFQVTDEMVARSKQIHIDGDLTLSALSPMDIFLFKSITMRDSDLLDMAFLAPMVKDWEPFRKEIDFFRYDYLLLSRCWNRMQDLEEEYQIKVPELSWMWEVGEMATAKNLILASIQTGRKEKKGLFEGLDKHEIHLIETAISELESAGDILDRGDTIEPS